jgi:hypothetical protein
LGEEQKRYPDTVRILELTGVRERVLHRLDGLSRVSQHPIVECGEISGNDAVVLVIGHNTGAVLLRVV